MRAILAFIFALTLASPTIAANNCPLLYGASDTAILLQSAIGVSGVSSLAFKKSTGSFGNVGMGGAASSSDAFPLLVQRDSASAINIQFSNPNTAAGAGVKTQVVANAGDAVFEMSQFSTATIAPDAYSGGRGIMRSTGTSAGISLVADTAATSSVKVYAGGNGAGNLTFSVDQYGPWLNPNAVAAPTCDVTKRGHLHFTAGASLSADTIEMCMKSTTDTYSWVVVKSAL